MSDKTLTELTHCRMEPPTPSCCRLQGNCSGWDKHINLKVGKRKALHGPTPGTVPSRTTVATGFRPWTLLSANYITLRSFMHTASLAFLYFSKFFFPPRSWITCVEHTRKHIILPTVSNIICVFPDDTHPVTILVTLLTAICAKCPQLNLLVATRLKALRISTAEKAYDTRCGSPCYTRSFFE